MTALEARISALEAELRRTRERGPERILIPLFNSSGVQIAEVEGLQESTNVTLARQTGDKRRLGTIAASGGGGGSALTVREEDGTPSDAAVTIIRVPNGGGLVANGVGDVSLIYEIGGAVAAHAALADPHTGYRLESADHTHQSTGAQAGQIDHGAALTGLADDDHTQYVLRSILTTNEDIFKRSAGAVARLGAPTDQKFLGGTGVTYAYPIQFGTYASRPSAAAGVVGTVYCATDRANTLYLCNTSSTWIVLNPRQATLRWNIDGRLRADASNGQGPIRYAPDLDGLTTESIALWKPVRCKVHVRVASAGADIIVQIEFGTTATPGTDLFASGNRPTIAAAALEATSTTFEDSAIENGTAFEVVIDQVGSTSAQEGTDLSVELELVQIDA